MISIDTIQFTSRVICIGAVVALLLSGCVSGGGLTPRKASDYKVLMYYRPEPGGPNADYYLIETEKGPAVLEQEQGDSGALADLHWRASDGDHFAIWISFLSRQGGAFEYVIPFDRTQPAKRFVYPAGSYTLMEMDGIERPVALNPARHPPLRLIPIPTAEVGH